MTLNVTVEPGRVPRVVLSGGTVGEHVTRVASDGSREIVTASMPSFPIVDPLAPLGAGFHYEHAGEVTRGFVRETREHGAFTSLDGETVAGFIMPQEWGQTVETGLATLRAGGRLWWTFPKTVDEGPFPVRARIAGKDISAMRALISGQAPFVFLHAKCPLTECPVPPALTVVVSDVGVSMSDRKDMGEQFFQMDLQPVPVDSPVPSRTWWHTMNENESWFGVDVVGEVFL